MGESMSPAKMFTVEKLSYPRTRNELNTISEGLVSMCHNSINLLYEKIKSRMEYKDLDGPSSWSKAPADSILKIQGSFGWQKVPVCDKYSVHL